MANRSHHLLAYTHSSLYPTAPIQSPQPKTPKHSTRSLNLLNGKLRKTTKHALATLDTRIDPPARVIITRKNKALAINMPIDVIHLGRMTTVSVKRCAITQSSKHRPTSSGAMVDSPQRKSGLLEKSTPKICTLWGLCCQQPLPLQRTPVWSPLTSSESW